MSSAIRVRFAPSPTGFLHIGGGAHGFVQLALRETYRRKWVIIEFSTSPTKLRAKLSLASSRTGETFIENS
jgi:hypothetical protein